VRRLRVAASAPRCAAKQRRERVIALIAIADRCRRTDLGSQQIFQLRAQLS
jgi:hypothetical protein